MNQKCRRKYGQSLHEKCPYSVHKIVFFILYSYISMTYMAEEVGVEPTSHFISSSTALKAARPTGDDALPSVILSNKYA